MFVTDMVDRFCQQWASVTVLGVSSQDCGGNCLVAESQWLQWSLRCARMGQESSMMRNLGLLVCLFSVSAPQLAAQTPVPEFYGIYAVADGKLTELQAKEELNDFAPDVRLLVFMKGVAVENLKLFLIPPAGHASASAGKFKGWDDFRKQSDKFAHDMQLQLLYGVDSSALEVPFQIGPYANNAEMVRIVPRQVLPPGLYQIAKGVRFWVRRSEATALYYPPEPAAAPPRAYPISSGTNLIVRVDLVNRAGRTFDVYLDGSESAIRVRLGETLKLEVGSIHHIKAVVGNETFETEFTVSNHAINEITIDREGIRHRR
jgi:hypothetical protein